MLPVSFNTYEKKTPALTKLIYTWCIALTVLWVVVFFLGHIVPINEKSIPAFILSFLTFLTLLACTIYLLVLKFMPSLSTTVRGIITTGSIDFHQTYLTQNGHIFQYSKMQNIKLFMMGYKGEDAGDGAKRNGEDNYIEFSFNNTVYKLYFTLTNKADAENYRAVAINFYEQNIKIKEWNVLGTTYGLEALNYAQIQEFKQKYKL
jgi:hypothetical protein